MTTMGSRRLTSEEFIRKARLIHVDKYNYSKSEYINFKTKVIIICPIHGEFKIMPESHYGKRRRGCPKCGNAKKGGYRKMDSESFIKRAKKVHGDKYNYNKVDYKLSVEKIIISCPKHGDFTQVPSSHLTGAGCLRCSEEINGKKSRMSLNEFIDKSNIIHNNRYLYSKAMYSGVNNYIIITCRIHGDFKQNASSHHSGSGCPECAKIRRERSSISHGGGWSKSNWVKKSEEAILYFLKLTGDDEEFIKIGITSANVKKRYNCKSSMPYDYIVLRRIVGSPYFIWDEEKRLHKLFSQYKYNPIKSFKGKSECYTLDIIHLI